LAQSPARIVCEQGNSVKISTPALVDRLYHRTRTRWETARAALNTPSGRRVMSLLQWGVQAALLAWLGWSLTRLGWGQVWGSRPPGISFYIVVLLQFYVQPVADLLIYRHLFHAGRALPLLVMMRKRYVNGMLDFSGEFYFLFWARKNLALPKGRLMHAVKDSNVLSGSAGLLMVWLALLAVILSGGVKLPSSMTGGFAGFLSLGSLPIILGLVLVIGGRAVTNLSRSDVLVTFAIHFIRGVVQLILEFLVWWESGALPSAAACFQFVALRAVVTRLPLVPNKNLVFVGVGIAAAAAVNASAPRVAAALVLATAIGIVQNLVLVGLPWLFEERRERHRVAAP
jgi:hypothetical protein